jgi:sorbose reductase
MAKAHNIRAKAYKVEVSDPSAVQKSIQQVVDDFGRVDVFVANAGMAISKPILDMEISEYKKLMEVNGNFSLPSHLSFTNPLPSR